ncbi:GH16913 [Drosophila grimshawi]|uniref:GH16913 n=1 Tax=Drosophila grimshawi TaxID=7222 RepID=B4IXQ1_DROGR|nr:GH16913 [Drosophila grimshawi]
MLEIESAIGHILRIKLVLLLGSQTISNTINLALMMLAMRQDVQEQVYAEVAANMHSSSNSSMQQFRVVLPEGETPSLILQPGITLTPKPYKVRFVKRK